MKTEFLIRLYVTPVMKIPSLSRPVFASLRRTLATSLAGLVFTASPSTAENRTWDGGDVSSDNWTVGDNWNGNTAPVAGDILFFDGVTRLTPNNNFANLTLFNGVTFTSDAGAFTLSGNSIILGGNLVNNSSNIQTVALTTRLGASGVAFNTAVGDIVMSGTLSDSNQGYNVDKVGAGVLTLSAANTTWNGGITIKEGTVRALNHTRNLGTASSVVTLAGGNLDLVHDNTGNFSYGNPVVVQSSGTITFDRTTAGNAGTRTMGAVSIGNQNLTIVKGSNISNAATNVFGAVTLSGDATFTITGDGRTQFGAVGETGGSHGFTKAGTGLLTLSAANTYTGVTTVSGGTLHFANGVGANGAIVNNAAIEITRTTSAGASFFGGAISGTGSITKLGNARVVLMADNSFSGTTTISAGTLQLGDKNAGGSLAGDIVNNGSLWINRSGGFAFGSVISGTGSVSLYNGDVTLTGANTNTGVYELFNSATLSLDFSTAGGPTDNIINNTSNSSALSFNGGGLYVLGADGETNTQRFNGITTTNGGGRIIATAGEGGTLGISLGEITLGSNGAIRVEKNAGATITTTTAADAGTGIYSGRMVMNDGTGWNFVTSTDIGGGQYELQAFTDYGDMIGSGSLTTNGGNALLQGAGALSGATLVNTLKIETTGEGESLNLGGRMLTLNATAVGGTNSIPGAILFTGADDYKIENGVINRNSGIPRTIIVQQYGQGVLEIAALITNGSPSAATSFVKAGFGELILSGSNSYDGSTTIQEGILTATHITNLGRDAQALNIFGGATFRAAATMVLASEATAKPVTLSGLDARIEVTGTNTLTVSGVVSGGNGSLNKIGTGRLVLDGINTYAGGTVVSLGTLVVNGSINNTVQVNSSASLAGHGTVGQIIGAGRVGPGNSPGILTGASVDQSAGLDYAFEFSLAGNPVWSNASSSGNDVLRLTGGTPILGNATAGNVFDIYFAAQDATYIGGIFTDADSNFESLVSGATYNYYVLNNAGSFEYNGNFYSLLDSSLVTRTTIQVASADFSGGTVTDGWTQQYVVAVPEPSTGVLMALGLGAALFARRRRLV